MSNTNFIDSEGHLVKKSNMIDEHQIIKITEKSPELKNIGKIVCGDANSNILTFEINRYYDNADLLSKNIKFIIKNELGTFTEDAVNIQYNNEFLRFSWVLSDSVTYKSGTVSAAIIFIGSESGNKYVLKTVPFTIKIENSLDFIVYDIEHKDWFTDIEYRLLNLEKGAIGEIDKKSLESALYDGITNTTTLDENDLIPLISESEDGHKSISKAVTLPTLAKEVANNIDIPGSEIAFENLTPVTDLTEDDEFLVGTAEGNKKIGCKALADGLKEMMNLEISSDEVSKIPFIRGFRIYMKDFNVTISANKNTCNICSLSDFGISDTNLVYGINGYTLPSGLHAYVFLDNNTIRIGRSSNFSTSENKVVRICLIVKDIEVTDGAGEEAIPLFPGYDIKTFTKTYNISSGNMGIKLMDLSEAGILEEDVAFVVATCSTNPLIGTGWAGAGVIFENAVYFSASKAASSSLTVPITFSIIYRKEGSVLTGLPDLFTTTEIPMAETITAEDKLLLGTADGNKVVQNKMFMDFLRENGLFDLDGQGRPLLPGYGIATRKVIIDHVKGGLSVDFCTIDELLGEIPPEDVVLCCATVISDVCNNSIGCYIDIDQNNVRGLWDYTPTITVSDINVVVCAIYKNPIPFEPGLKTISIRKNVTVSSHTGIACQLSETGITDPSIIVSMSAISYSFEGITNVYAFLNNQDVMIYYPGNANTYVDQDIQIDILVKDYSSIGPSIVTEGIRTIEKIVDTVGNNSAKIPVANISEFGITKDELAGMLYVSLSANAQMPTMWHDVKTGTIYASFISSIPTSVAIQGCLTLLVKVPVVEQKLKPFTKDLEVTLNGETGVSTKLFLDGSDNIGGYTIDNLHFYYASALTPEKVIHPMFIKNNNELFVCGVNQNHTGLCKIRIHIE